MEKTVSVFDSSCSFPHYSATLSMIHPDASGLFWIDWGGIRAPVYLLVAFRVKHWLAAVKMVNLFTVVSLLAVFSSGLCAEKQFLQRAGQAFNSRQYKSVLSVNNGEQFGNWTWPEMCPQDFFAVGFSIRVKTLTRSHTTYFN